MARDAALVAAGSAFVFLGKILDKAFGWRRSREDLATQLRSELREETQRLKKEIEDLRAEVTFWREKYLTEKEENGRLRNDRDALRDDFEELKKRLADTGVTT
jgi:predicted nuclease with TOPRIM domain